nr:preprotein translocase subunit SecA [uncultured Desulfobacter sp.]
MVNHSGAVNIYPERKEEDPSGINAWFSSLEGYFTSRKSKYGSFSWIADAVKAVQPQMQNLNDQEILKTVQKIKLLLKKQSFSREAVAQAFALVREMSGRHLGMSHHDVQLVGGYVLLNGMVAEMETGEGKTLVATLPACTMALAGIPVHVITVNDYLAQRDAAWMTPVYKALGLSVGIVIHGMDPAARRAAYRCDVTYCCNKEVAFDYLRDRVILWDRPSQLRLKIERLCGGSRDLQVVMQGLHFAIVDEADSVLVDEARTPLILSSQAEGFYEPAVYRHAMAVAETLVSGRDFILSKERHTVELTRAGKSKVFLADWDSLASGLNEKQQAHLVRQGISALYLFKPDKQYLVKDGKVQIIDEYTGRLMADRSWEMGLHQLIEIKEKCEMTSPKKTLARISYQRFFRRYIGMAGMTGTAREVAKELWSVYRMPVVKLATNRPVQRRHIRDRIYESEAKKWEAVVKTVSNLHAKGRPVLIGTRSVQASERLSRFLVDAGLPHKVLNARQDQEEAEIISKAGKTGQITVATNMAGRGTDIQLAPEVIEIGGLHVIGTERHESARIDRQLFGRCARQGEPGSCQNILSIDDELVQVYVGRIIRWMAMLVIRLKIIFFSNRVGNMIFNMGQQAAERRHLRVRRQLLKMDEQIGESLSFTGRLE